MKSTLLCLWGCAFVVGGTSTELNKKEQAMLQGTWKLVRCEFAGQVLPVTPYLGDKIRFEKDKIIRSAGGKPIESELTTFQLIASAKPKAMNILRDKKKKTTLDKCIYMFVDDVLEICVDGADRPEEERQRPTGFDTAELNEARPLMIYRREKK